MSDSAGDALLRALFTVVKAMKCARGFVELTMDRLQREVKAVLVAQGKDIDCSGCSVFDVGPMQLTVTSLSADGVFTTDVPHCFDQGNPLRVEHPVSFTFANVPPSLAAAGVVEGAPVYVRPDPSNTIKDQRMNFMCQRAKASDLLPLSDAVGPFTCQVSKLKGYGLNSTTVTETLTVVVATTPPLLRPSLWRVAMQKGAQVVEKHGLTKTSRLMFLSGSEPPGVSPDTWYSVAPSGSSYYFDLVNNPICAGAVLPPNAALAVRRCQTGQFNVADEAMKHHTQTDPNIKRTNWSSIRADRLLDDTQCGDFAKMFVASSSKKDVDLFNSQENGEFMFLMIQYCKEFRKFSSFCSNDAEQAAFQQFAGDAILDLASSAVNCSLGRNGLSHALEQIERAALADEDLAHVQSISGNVEKFLGSIVTILTALEKAECVRAGDEVRFKDAVRVAQEGLEELRGLAGKKILMTPEMEAEKNDMIEENQRLLAENKLLKQESVRQREESERQREESERKNRIQQANLGFANILNLCSEVPKFVQARLADWADGSRQLLLMEMVECARNHANSRFKVLWLHGQRGCGKSSSICQIMKILHNFSDGVYQLMSVFHHSFIRSHQSSAIQIALANCCAQIYEDAFKADSHSDMPLMLLRDLLGDFDDRAPDLSILRELLVKRELPMLCDGLIKLLHNLDARSKNALVVICFDAIDEVSEYFNAEDPHDSLKVHVLNRMRDGTQSLTNINVTFIVSSIRKPPIDVNLDPFPVSDYLSTGDIEFLIDAELRVFQGALDREPWLSVVEAYMKHDDGGRKINMPQHSDIRLQRTWMKLVLSHSRTVAQKLIRIGADPSSQLQCVKQSLEILNGVKSAEMDGVVQMYLYQSMLYAFPADESSVWHQKVFDACRVLLLAAFFGVDSLDVQAIACAFYSSDNVADRSILLAEHVQHVLRDIVSSRDGTIVHFQSHYMDVFRRARSVSSTRPSGLFGILNHLTQYSDELKCRADDEVFTHFHYVLFDVNKLASEGVQYLRSLHGDVKLFDLMQLLDIAILGQSVEAMCTMFCFMLESHLDAVAQQPGLCLRVCKGVDCALLFHKEGIWCHFASDCVPKFASSVCLAMKRSFDLKTWPDKTIAAVLEFSHRSRKEDSASDALSKIGWGDGAVPEYLYVYSSLFNEFQNDAKITESLERNFASRYSAADRTNAKLLSHNSPITLYQILNDEIATDANTWLILMLRFRRDASSLEEIVAILMPFKEVQSNVLHWTTLMKAYTSPNDREEVLMRMQEAPGVVASVNTWSILMDSYTSSQDCEDVLRRMQDVGITASVTTWNVLMNRYELSHDREDVLNRMHRDGCAANSPTWNTLMKAYRSPNDCEDVLKRMQATGVDAEVRTWNTLMRAYCSPSDCEDVLRRMQAAGVDADVSTWNILMKAYRSPNDCEDVLKRMQAAGVDADVSTWNTLMNCYPSFNQRHDVLVAMLSPPQSRVPCLPNLFTFVTLFDSNDIRRPDIKQRVLKVAQQQSDSNLCHHRVLGKLIRFCADANQCSSLDRYWKIGYDGLSSSRDGWPGHYLFNQFNNLCSKLAPNSPGWAHLLAVVNSGQTGLYEIDGGVASTSVVISCSLGFGGSHTGRGRGSGGGVTREGGGSGRKGSAGR